MDYSSIRLLCRILGYKTVGLRKYLLYVLGAGMATLQTISLAAQSFIRYNTFSYNVNEGLLQSTLSDMAVDQNNFLWIAFPNGIQKFDGRKFINIPVQPGLPDDKICRFMRLANGELLISHSRGISRYLIHANRFSIVYQNAANDHMPPIFIGEEEQKIYFCTASFNIAELDNTSFRLLSLTATGLPEFGSNEINRPLFCSKIVNRKVAFYSPNKLHLYDLQKKAIQASSKEMPSLWSYFIFPKSEHEVYYYQLGDGNRLSIYNFITGNSSSFRVNGLKNEHISRCILLPWQNKTLVSFTNHLCITDPGLQQVESEIVSFQNKPAVAGAAITFIREDNFGNLWLGTVNRGIRKIIRNNFRIKYYGTETREQNNALSVLPDKINNRVLSGTGNGLYVFDTLQRLVKHIGQLPGKTGAFSVNAIIKNNEGSYLLFVVGEKSLWKLNAGLNRLTAMPITSEVPPGRQGVHYFGVPVFQNGSGAITQAQGRLYKTSFVNNTVNEVEFSQSYTHSGIWYHNTIVSHANDELLFIEPAHFTVRKKIPFPNTGYVRCFAQDDKGFLYLGSNKGLFKTDSTGKIYQHLKKENGLPDECIYAMAFDAGGNLWCSSNRGVFKVSRNNEVLLLSREDGLQENEFNTNVVATAPDGEIFFGGVNGISSFYPNAISGFEEKINMLVTQIKIDNQEAFPDTAVWNINRVTLPYNRNTLSFDFIAIAGNNPGQYTYQYKMEGIDGEWVQNEGMQTVRYTLPPGRYVFKLYASRFFNKDARPLKEITIIIHPPFWKTWWFITGISLLCAGALVLGINRYNKARYHKKLAAIENEYKIQLERERISRELHDSLGAYAQAVLYNSELLEKEKTEPERKELLGTLKFASKDIITALRETVWALKKEIYSADECLVRIRNFTQSLTRYYHHIHFRVEGNAPPEMQLGYKKALDVVRTVQEAITNSIKHANAKNIIIFSEALNNKWLLTITDDGTGFNKSRAEQDERGNGLNNMHQRALHSGFEINIVTQEEKGTRITLNI